MRITLFITLALALAGCAETSEAINHTPYNFVGQSHGYELGCVNVRKNPPIDCWNGAFATGN